MTILALDIIRMIYLNIKAKSFDAKQNVKMITSSDTKVLLDKNKLIGIVPSTIAGSDLPHLVNLPPLPPLALAIQKLLERSITRLKVMSSVRSIKPYS